MTWLPAIAMTLGCSGEPTRTPTRPLDAGPPRDVPFVYDRPPEPDDITLPPFVPQGAKLRRLTRSQYANAIRDLFGEAVLVPAALEPDVTRSHSTAVGASESSISPRGTEQYQTAAYEIAEQVLRDPMRRAGVLTCTPAGVVDAACAETFVRAVGRRVWRRPLEAEEVTRLVTVAGAAAMALGDFARGLEYAFAAMLQSPDFLFRAELGRDASGGRRYAGYELASRLAFFLWDSTPDDALLDAAAGGSIDTDEGLGREVDRMLASPKARRGLRAFVTDWLHLAELDELSKDAAIFPSFSADFGAAAREEALRVTESFAFDRDADFRDVMTTRETYVNRRLAALYGVQFPVRDAPVTQFAQVTLPTTQPRRGILGMAAFLSLFAHPVSTSPTLRGKFIGESLLCQSIPMPPVNVNTAIPEPSRTLRTLRERLAAHRENPSCAGCHDAIDPVGLGLEHFDGIGRYRAVDNGVQIDASGVFEQLPFRDAADIAEIVRGHPDFTRCLVSRVYRHAWGQVAEGDQRAEVERLRVHFGQSGYRFRALVREVAMSAAFRNAGLAPAGDGGM